LSLAYLLSQNQTELSKPRRWAGYGMLGLSTLITVLLHSRALIILAVIFLAWVVATWQEKLAFTSRVLIFVITIFALALEIFFVQQEALFTLLLDPYINKGVWMTVLVLCLSIFAVKKYSQVSLVCILSMCFLIGCLFVPVNIPSYGALTLLDRPFVEMILYLPLSLLGGLGLAGFINVILQSRMKRFLLHRYTGLFLIGLVGIHAFYTYNFYPAQCCMIAGQDDIQVIAWIKNHLPAEASIGISTTEMDVLISDSPEGLVGTDAGIWITPLIGRVVSPLFYSSDFGQQSVRDVLCQNGIDYLYVGALGQHFDTQKLNAHPEWYRTVLVLQKIRVYEVMGCT
jgi:hypothetical protein